MLTHKPRKKRVGFSLKKSVSWVLRQSIIFHHLCIKITTNWISAALFQPLGTPPTALREKVFFFFWQFLCSSRSISPFKGLLPPTSESKLPRVHIPEPAKVSGPVGQHDTLQLHTKIAQRRETLTHTEAAQQVTISAAQHIHGQVYTLEGVGSQTSGGQAFRRCWPTPMESFTPHNHKPSLAKHFWLLSSGCVKWQHGTSLIWRSAPLTDNYSLTLWRWRRAGVFSVFRISRSGRSTEKERMFCLPPAAALLLLTMPIKHGEMEWTEREWAEITVYSSNRKCLSNSN